MLKQNGYPNPLIDRVFKTEIKRLNYIKPYGPENCQVFLILPNSGEKSTQIERNIKKSIEKIYRAAKPRVIFTASSVLSPLGKDLISNKHKNCVIYCTFECCCLKSYIGQTSNTLKPGIKEQIPNCVREHVNNQPKTKDNQYSNFIQYQKIQLKIQFMEKVK